MPDNTRRFETRHKKWLGVLLTLSLALGLGVPSAQAISFDTEDGEIAYPDDTYVASDGVSDPTNCPTLEEAPDYFEVWLNTDDLEERGWWDPKDNSPWSFASRISQIVCGAAKNSEIRIGMYFIRAIGTATRPEADSELMFDALQWVHENRNVDIELVLDQGLHSGVNLEQVEQRFEAIGGTVEYCYNGCFNVNKGSKYPYAIEHEKYLAISDTTWDTSDSDDHPVVLSTSGNWARSQIRNYWQEATLIYDDYELWSQFDLRANALMSCADGGCGSGSTAITKAGLEKERKIWIDPYYRHATDPDRGTYVAFAPQASDAPDYYVAQFDGLDCTVDSKVRVAMFKLTDSKAERLAESVARLQDKGCDVELVISSSYGANVVSTTVKKTLNNADVDFYCSSVPMHTKMILIGPEVGNDGRVLVGTANMSTSGLRYSDEHVLTLDTRLATGEYKESLRRAYGNYLAGWDDLANGRESC